jgi:outer membrane protein OmpU
MKNLKKVGLTALAASLATVSAHAGDLSVTGAASIYYSAKEKANSTGFYMNDKVNFTGTGDVNGMTLTVGLNLDETDMSATNTYDERYLKLATDGMGTVTFWGRAGSTVTSSMDDKMPASYEETWDGADGPGQGSAATNSFYYSNDSLADGINFATSYTPGGNGEDKGSMDFGITYTGTEGLTVAMAMGEDNGPGANKTIDNTIFYTTYAVGSVTVGYQHNDSDSEVANGDEVFDAYAISYTVSDDMTVSWGHSELDYDAGATNSDTQEATAIGVSYTMGSVGFVGSIHSIKNASGSSAATSDYNEYEVGLTFAF